MKHPPPKKYDYEKYYDIYRHQVGNAKKDSQIIDSAILYLRYHTYSIVTILIYSCYNCPTRFIAS